MNDYRLTALDVAALKMADTIVVRWGHDGTAVRASKHHKRTDKDPFAPTETTIDLSAIEVCLRPNGMCTNDIPAGATAIEVMNLYPGQRTPTWSLFQLLRAGDQVTFEFYSDYHSNQYMARAGLHGDVLLMHVSRGEGKARKAYCYEVASSNCPSNSARMVRGVPDSETYRRDAAAA